MIGFGIPVRTLSQPVLYLQSGYNQRSPSSDFGENQLLRGLISLSLLLSSHLRIFQHPRVRSSTGNYPGFNLLKSRSPPLRVYCLRPDALFTLAFASHTRKVMQATDNNSQTHYAKGRPSACKRPTTHCRLVVAGSLSLPCNGFFSPFPRGTSSLSVVREYLALSGGPDRFTQSSTCIVLLGIPLSTQESSNYAAVTRYGRPFQTVRPELQGQTSGSRYPPATSRRSLGSFAFARRY